MSKPKVVAREDIDMKFHLQLSIFIDRFIYDRRLAALSKIKDFAIELISSIKKTPNFKTDLNVLIENLIVKKNLSESELISLQKSVYILLHPLSSEQKNKDKIQYLRRVAAVFLGLRKLFNSNHEGTGGLCDKSGALIEKNIVFDKESQTNIIHFLFSQNDIEKEVIEISLLQSSDHEKKSPLTILKILYGKSIDKIEDDQQDFFSNVVKSVVSFFDGKITVFHSVIFNKNNEMLKVIQNSINLVVKKDDKEKFIEELLSKNDSHGYSPLTTACALGNIDAINIIFELSKNNPEIFAKQDANGNNALLSACLNQNDAAIEKIFDLMKYKNKEEIKFLLIEMINQRNLQNINVLEVAYDKISSKLKDFFDEKELATIADGNHSGDEGIEDSPDSSPSLNKKTETLVTDQKEDRNI